MVNLCGACDLAGVCTVAREAHDILEAALAGKPMPEHLGMEPEENHV